jgi:hypothetical protein
MSELSFPAVVVRCFDLQHELIRRYQPIEQYPTPPVSLHTATEQRLLKDFAWRLTEELGESYDAYIKHIVEDAMEELIDTFHFYFELCIFAGVTPPQLLIVCPNLPGRLDHVQHAEELYWDVIFKLSQAMHVLKNRPWKKSLVLTDEALFRARLVAVFPALCQLWRGFGRQEQLYEMFHAKHVVNVQRQLGSY